MNKQEFLTVMELISQSYPSFNKDLDKDGIKRKNSVWYEMLKMLDYEQAKAGVLKYINNNKFPPTIADIKECSLLTENVLSPEEAYRELMKAANKHGIWDLEKTKQMLSPLTLKAAESMGLREIFLSEEPELTRTRFLKTFEAYYNREKQDAMLTGNTSRLLGNDGLKMIGDWI